MQKLYEAKLGLEATDQVWQGALAVRANLYQRTMPLKPHGDRKTPVDHLRYWRERMALIRNWLVRNNFPVNLRHLDAAHAALADAMIDLHKQGGREFRPASYPDKRADPAAAETLDQFAKMLRRSLSQPLVTHPVLATVAEEWDAFLDDFAAAIRRLKETGELPEQV